jgi:hypothetical protein
VSPRVRVYIIVSFCSWQIQKLLPSPAESTTYSTWRAAAEFCGVEYLRCYTRRSLPFEFTLQQPCRHLVAEKNIKRMGVFSNGDSSAVSVREKLHHPLYHLSTKARGFEIRPFLSLGQEH